MLLVSRVQLRTGGFVGAKFYCLHALADGNQRIRIREKTLEFSSAVLSTRSHYCTNAAVMLFADILIVYAVGLLYCFIFADGCS